MPNQRRRTRRTWAAVVAVAGVAIASLITPPASQADLRDDIANTEAYIQELEMQAAAAHGRVEEAQYALEQLRAKMSKTRSKVDQAKSRLTETQDSIGRYAATAYRSGGVDSSLQLLLVDNPQEFLDQAVILDIIASGQSAALRRTQTARVELAQASAELSQQEVAEAQALENLRQQEEDFNNKVAASQNYLAGLEQELREQIAAEKARREAEAKAAAEAAAAALAAGVTSSPSGGSGGTTSANGGPNDGGSANAGNYSGGAGVSSDKAAIVVNYALAQVGKPYSFAAQPPDSWDCTKLTSWAWAQVGVQLTPYSYVQAQEVQRISADELQPGDLLFFFENGAHHASMYIGGGMIVEASSPEVGVRVTDVWNSWNVAHFSWAGRPYA